jgi:hypothetical protein
MAHYTLIARINAGDGKFPFVSVQFSKNHRPIPIEGATYYLRPSGGDNRTPIRIGKGISLAQAAIIRMEESRSFDTLAALRAEPPSSVPAAPPRKTVAEAAREYIERSKQKSCRTYLGYRVAVNLFVGSCKKTYFGQISRDDMLDFLYELRTRPSRETGRPIGESTVFNYFLKTMVFLNDRGISKYVAREDWVQKKDWPINVDKRNKNKKYATYKEQEVAAMLLVANSIEEARALDEHLDRIVNRLIDKANKAGYIVKKSRKPCHAFRVLYATRRHQHGVDIETLRQELGHSDITTTQIYLRSANTRSDGHRSRINEADRFSLIPTPKPFLRRAAVA